MRPRAARRCLALAAVAALVVGAGALPSSAVTIPVPCSASTLVAAIEAANADPSLDTIALAPDCVYSFSAPYTSASTNYDNWYGPSALPAIGSPITIEGNGATIERSSASVPFRLLFVGADPADADTFQYATPGAGILTLRDLTLKGGLAQGGDSNGGGGGAGMGGAIFSQGRVSLAAGDGRRQRRSRW